MPKPRDIMFTYLNGLRESGETNMFGAGPYIEREFGLNKIDAMTVVVKWMESFNEKSEQSADT